MTGPEHYREAERLLLNAAGMETYLGDAVYCVQAAQVHATLALAAATALNTTGSTLVAWWAAAGPKDPS